MMQEIDREEIELLAKFRLLKAQRHGKLLVEVRDAKVQMIEITNRYKID